MKRRIIPSLPWFGAALLALGSLGYAQEALFDKVMVDFPNPMHVGDNTLPAGQYEFRQVHSTTGGSRVLIATSDGARKFEAAVLPVPAVVNNTPEKTSFQARRVANDYYLERLWIAGKDYGYQFEVPYYVQSRMDEERAAKNVNVWLLYTAPEAGRNGDTRGATSRPGTR